MRKRRRKSAEPGRSRARIRRARLPETCALCGKSLGHGPITTLTGRMTPAAAEELKRLGGRVFRVYVAALGRHVEAVVPAEDSPARREGVDLFMVLCSDECARTLRQAIAQDLAKGQGPIDLP